MAEVVDGQVKGFSPVWGVAAPVVLAAMGAAAAVARLDERQFAQAIGLAVSNSPLPAGALWSRTIDLPNCKYCDAGWCAVAGVFAVLSVEAGSTGFDDALDGPCGLARMCGVETFDEALIVAGLGQTWLIQDVTYKLWPTCRFTHYALTSLDRIVRQNGLGGDDIEEIVIETGPMAASDRFTKPRPTTFASRSFSYPHMVAMLVRGIPPGPAWLAEAGVGDPATLEIAEKVRVVEHARGGDFARTMAENQIRTMPGGVVVRTRDGTFREEDDFALGDPWTETSRATDADLVAKFLGQCGDGAADLADRLLRVEREPSASALMADLDAHVKEQGLAAAA
jgi:2-methylcitrate dehydratase PrpD